MYADTPGSSFGVYYTIMNALMFVAQMPVPGGSHLLQPAKVNLFAAGFGGVLGAVLLVAWIRFCPRLKIKRFSFWFWAGLAVCAIIGPIVGGWFQ
jgi:hypothetical protein